MHGTQLQRLYKIRDDMSRTLIDIDEVERSATHSVEKKILTDAWRQQHGALEPVERAIRWLLDEQRQ